MKRMLFTIVLLPAALWAGDAALPQFELMQPLEADFAAGQRGRLAVDDDLFLECRAFPNDLRIFGADGTQWPFFLHRPKAAAEKGRLTPEIRNRSMVDGATPYLQFDLLLPESAGAAFVHNRLELVASGRDFVRRVELFSGEPRGRLAAGYLIDFSAQRNARNRTIRYPDSDARRLHVRIYANAQEADETFKLVSARMHYRRVVRVERQAVAAARIDVPAREQDDDAQTLLFDLGGAGRPVEFISFDVENDSYARSVSIRARNSDLEPWSWIGGGEIHAFEDEVRSEIKLNARHRFLKVQVFHYDDPPLVFKSVQLQAVPRYLVFEAAAAGRAAVCFRAWDLSAPRYDLKERIGSDFKTLPLYSTLETRPNEAAQKQSWRNYSKWLAALAVGAVSLLVIGIIVSMLRQQQSREEG